MSKAIVVSRTLTLSTKTTKDPIIRDLYNAHCRGRIRANLVINVLLVCLVGFPFLGYHLATFIINTFLALIWPLFVLLALRSQLQIQKMLKTPKDGTFSENPPQLQTIMSFCIYKEPLSLILHTLNNISTQPMAKHIIMLVSMEAKTPEKDTKIKSIVQEFESKFKKLFITVHPYGKPGEIPGKCSNNNYGIRSLVAHLKETDKSFDPEKYIVSNCDIDTKFHPRFLEIQYKTVLAEKDRKLIVWQPVLYYNWGLDKLSVFTRITGVVRSVLMMGALIPFNINIMSVYTASLSLYIDGGYVHPNYQMDDIICYIRWLTITRKNIKIKPIYCPTISGPTSGDNFCHEFAEWARQIRRWSVGTAEVFHYFCVKAKRIRVFKAISWGATYLLYYVFFQCGMSLLSISTAIAINTYNIDKWLYQLFLIPIVIVYLSLALAIISNKIAVHYILNEIDMEENIPFYREIFHFILSPFVLLCYGLAVVYGFFEVVFRGRKVCKHDASDKAHLEGLEEEKVENLKEENLKEEKGKNEEFKVEINI